MDVDPIETRELYEHLVEDHHRLPHELVGLPLDAVHELEHFDDVMGLLSLRHRHSA